MKSFFTAILLILLTNASLANNYELTNINIIAPESITLPMVEISRVYSKENLISVTTSFESNKPDIDKILKNISAVPVNIFISTNQDSINKLNKKNMIDIYSLTNFLKNKIVLASNKNYAEKYKSINNKDINSQISFLAENNLLVISDTQNTEQGVYTKKILKTIYKEDVAESIINKAIKTSNLEDMAEQIEQNEKFGILYISDLINYPNIKIIKDFSNVAKEHIIYRAVIIKGKNMSKADKFIEFLKSKKALNIFKNYGLITEN